MAELRRAVIGSSAAVALAGLGLALAFGVLLEPGGQDGGSCMTGLYPGTYADLLLPFNLTAFAALGVGLLELARRLGRTRPAALTLAVATAYLVACLAYHPLFGPYGLVALVLSMPASLGLAVALVLQVLAGRRDASVEARWRRFARASWVGQWAVLLVLLPGAYTFAWLNGAGVFCF